MDEYLITNSSPRRRRRPLLLRLTFRWLRVLAALLFIVAKAVEAAIREPLVWLLLAGALLRFLYRFPTF